MPATEDRVPSLARLPPRTAAAVAAPLVLLVLGLDFLTPANVILPVLYVVPLVVSSRARAPRSLWVLALLLAGLTVAGGYGGLPPTVPGVEPVVFLNRLLIALTLFLVAGVLHLWVRSERAVEAHERRLERQNAERDSARREAEEAAARKARFLAAVAHDIRTPANAINLMAEVIGRSASTPSPAAQVSEMARRLRANALALVALISDVLEIVRLDCGKLDLQESEFSLGGLIEEECRRLESSAQEKRLELAVVPPSPPVWLRADQVKLGRVLSHLVGKAVALTEEGRVEVGTGLGPQGEAWVRVCATGAGIAPEQLDLVFDEVAQLRSAARDASKGTGLGLVVGKRLLEAMGGSLRVESTPGKGSAFVVTLPASGVLPRPAPVCER